jgi:hypothetical protein
MSNLRAVTEEPTLERAVFVEACDSGWDPRTVVRQIVWHDGHVHEELQVFPNLREALAYAREACASPNGPLLASH